MCVTILSIRFFTGTVMYFRGPYGLRPVMLPVKIIWVTWIRVFPAENHAVYEAAKECDEAEDEKHYA